MNQALGKFEVCCRKPAEFESTAAVPAVPLPAVPSQPVSNNNNAQPQVLQQQTSSCPAVTSLPPLSSCEGRQSNCWSVGVADLDCLDDALCCFDGCANVCMGRGE